MAKITVDLSEKLGKIKPLHAGGQPNLGPWGNHDFHILSEIGVPYSRLHDVGGAFGSNRFVDIPNIFRDFNADENDPASYDFAFTDNLIKDLVRDGIEPYFRLGVTIENGAHVKSYRIFPPADYDKWARICEHIMAHYMRGWANGYNFKITYWEIWNEPDNVASDGDRQMWTGTPEEYYRLYDVTAKHLKKVFPEIKIGGYASCGFYNATVDWNDPKEQKHKKVFSYYIEFFEGFFKYIKEHGSPIDFFSWHSYDNPKNALKQADYVEKALADLGYPGLETHINEWNPHPETRGTAAHGAEISAMLLGMQDKPAVQVMCIYDMRTTGFYAPFYNSMIDKPTYGYYAFAAFNRLYQLGTQVKVSSDTEGLYAVAATDGKHNALMLANLTGDSLSLEIEGVDLTEARYYVMDSARLLTWAANAKQVEKNGVVLIEF